MRLRSILSMEHSYSFTFVMNKTHLSKNIINLKICFFVGQTSKQKLTEKFWLYKCISLFTAYIWYFLSRLWHLENYIVTKGAVMVVIIGSWIYNYICNQCLSPLRFWIPLRQGVPDTTLCDKVCQWLATGQWFSPGTPVSSTNIKTDLHHKNEILLKVALNNITLTIVTKNEVEINSKVSIMLWSLPSHFI